MIEEGRLAHTKRHLLFWPSKGDGRPGGRGSAENVSCFLFERRQGRVGGFSGLSLAGQKLPFAERPDSKSGAFMAEE